MRFADIVGHEPVAEMLRRAVTRNRIPHAILFHGPDGVGKRSMALAFFSYLVCEERGPDDACGVCRACRMVADGAFPDLHVAAVDRAQIKIDEMRALMSRLYLQPMMGPWKCVLLDEAHLLNLPAANAALKTLEEPPSRTLFILITPTPDLLPQTIVSRCFQVPFGPLPASVVADFLRRRRPDLPEAGVLDAAAQSRGSIGLALQLLENPALQERKEFLLAFLALPAQGPAERLRFSEGVAANREEAPAWMSLLGILLSDLLLAASGQPSSALANADLWPQIQAFVDQVGVDRLLAVVDAYREWDRDRRYYPSTRTALDRIVLAI